jgi:S1-C subfamily serine protease
VLLNVLTLLLAGAAALVLGALTLHLSSGLPRGVAFGLAVAAAALFALLLPLLLDRLVTNAYRKLDSEASSTWRQTALTWNGALLAFAVFAAPKTTRAALETHGAWMLGGGSASGVNWVARHIPRSAAVAEQVLLEAPRPTGSGAPSAGTPAAAPPGPPPAPPPTLPDQAQTPEQVFALRADAVVVISVREAIAEGTPAAQIFGRLGIRNVPAGGSGFLVSDDGLIVTNHHVVADALSAEVTLKDGRRFDQVTVEVSDPKHDLALLRVSGKGLPRLPLAGTDKVTPGARAIAIGSPLGLEFSVTDGIISNTRSISGTTFLQMQTDVAPGSSGGPLFDDRGRVIGVNTATRAAGINLAVFVKHVHELLSAPRAPRQWPVQPPQARISDVEVNSTESSPTDLMQFEEAVRFLALAGEGCVHSVPEKAELTLAYTVNNRSGLPAGEPALGSNLAPADFQCLNGAIGLFGELLAMVLVHTYPGKITKGETIELAFKLQGLPLPEADAAAPSVRPIAVRLTVARPAPK